MSKRHPMEAPIILTVNVIDVAEHARTLFGRETADAIHGSPLPEHDYRFEVHTSTMQCSFGRQTTAAEIGAWFEREGRPT